MAQFWMIPLATGVSLLLGLAISLEAGFRFGRRAAKNREAPSGAQMGAIQGAMLGLLALLLGFSFAGAASRFVERQDLIISEANAIGTAYLRADLLDQPHRALLQAALADYTAHRIEASKHLKAGLTPQVADEVRSHHDRIWAAAAAGAAAKPATMMPVLPPVNEVIDLHATRVAAGRRHLPALVMTLLIACSMLAIGVIGYGCGLANRRCLPMSASLAILVGAALWTTIDLDHPRVGLILLDDAPLQELNLPNPE